LQYSARHRGLWISSFSIPAHQADSVSAGKEQKKRKKKKEYNGKRIQDFSELSIGDYVVHEKHGLGIYKGIEKVAVDKVAKDYIKIEYRNGSNLYILSNTARCTAKNTVGKEQNRTNKKRVVVREVEKETKRNTKYRP